MRPSTQIRRIPVIWTPRATKNGARAAGTDGLSYTRGASIAGCPAGPIYSGANEIPLLTIRSYGPVGERYASRGRAPGFAQLRRSLLAAVANPLPHMAGAAFSVPAKTACRCRTGAGSDALPDF